MAECWRLKSAGRDQRDDQHERGYAEAVEYRNEDRDWPNLHRDSDPGRSPDDVGPEEENEGVQGWTLRRIVVSGPDCAGLGGEAKGPRDRRGKPD